MGLGHCVSQAGQLYGIMQVAGAEAIGASKAGHNWDRPPNGRRYLTLHILRGAGYINL